MGTQGAALATVLAQAVSVVLSIFIIRRRFFRFHSAKGPPVPKTHIKRIITVGAPVAFQDLLVNISFLVIMARKFPGAGGLRRGRGSGKLCMFIMLVPSALAGSRWRRLSPRT